MAKFLAFLIAICVHLFVIAGLNFMPKSQPNRKKEKVINVTFEKRIAQKAQINQISENQTQVEPPKPKIIPKPIVESKSPKPIQKIISVPKSEKIVIAKKVNVEPIKPKIDPIEKK